MSMTVSYLWPMVAIGLVVALIAGLIAFSRTGKSRVLIVAAVISLAAAASWHWPFGAAERFAAAVDRDARQALDYYEMTKVTGRLHRNPLSRTLTLAGPADDFQHSELVRLLSELPGVRKASWSAKETGLPLIAEGWLANLGGFLLGLLFAYLVQLHRRHNAQWTW